MVNYDFDKGDPDFETVMVGAMEAEHRIAYTIINTFDEMLVTSRQKAIAARSCRRLCSSSLRRVSV
jgi:hypothetical protein